MICTSLLLHFIIVRFFPFRPTVMNHNSVCVILYLVYTSLIAPSLPKVPQAVTSTTSVALC